VTNSRSGAASTIKGSFTAVSSSFPVYGYSFSLLLGCCMSVGSRREWPNCLHPLPLQFADEVASQTCLREIVMKRILLKGVCRYC
jgi:hypothetical protein